jgi:hypothetical protein
MTADGQCPGTASEFPWEKTEIVPDAPTDAAAPHLALPGGGGGPHADARQLIAEMNAWNALPPDQRLDATLAGEFSLHEWAGRATAVLRELTREPEGIRVISATPVPLREWDCCEHCSHGGIEYLKARHSFPCHCQMPRIPDA